jgi:hypothetical protein
MAYPSGKFLPYWHSFRVFSLLPRPMPWPSLVIFKRCIFPTPILDPMRRPNQYPDRQLQRCGKLGHMDGHYLAAEAFRYAVTHSPMHSPTPAAPSRVFSIFWMSPAIMSSRDASYRTTHRMPRGSKTRRPLMAYIAVRRETSGLGTPRVISTWGWCLDSVWPTI